MLASDEDQAVGSTPADKLYESPEQIGMRSCDCSLAAWSILRPVFCKPDLLARRQRCAVRRKNSSVIDCLHDKIGARCQSSSQLDL